MALFFPQAICLALGIAVTPAGVAKPASEVRDSERHIQPAARDAITMSFMATLSETGDVASALDAVLHDPRLGEWLGPDNPPEEMKLAALKALERMREKFAVDPRERVRVGGSGALDDLRRIIDLLPNVNQIGDQVKALAAAGGQALPTRAEILALLLGSARDPAIAPRIAAGMVGSLSGPIALHLLVAARSELSDDDADYLADVAEEGMHDGLRMQVALLENFSVAVDEIVLPRNDRMSLKFETLNHQAMSILVDRSADG